MVSGSSEKALLYKELLSEQNQAYMVFQRFDSFTFRVLVLVLVLSLSEISSNLREICIVLQMMSLESPFTFWKETARASPDSVTLFPLEAPPRAIVMVVYTTTGGGGRGVYLKMAYFGIQSWGTGRHFWMHQSSGLPVPWLHQLIFTCFEPWTWIMFIEHGKSDISCHLWFRKVFSSVLVLVDNRHVAVQ